MSYPPERPANSSQRSSTNSGRGKNYAAMAIVMTEQSNSVDLRLQRLVELRWLNYNTSGPTGSGVNNVSVFDLIVFNEEWGRWGFGPLIQFVPNNGNGNDTALAGPAVGFVARHGKMNLGLFNQNLFGAETRFSSLQPIVAYVLPHGWSLAQATRSGASTGRVRASSTSRSACRSPR